MLHGYIAVNIVVTIDEQIYKNLKIVSFKLVLLCVCRLLYLRTLELKMVKKIKKRKNNNLETHNKNRNKYISND